MLSMKGIDLWSIHQAELKPFTGAIKIPLSHNYLTTCTYIIYLVLMAIFTSVRNKV